MDLPLGMYIIIALVSLSLVLKNESYRLQLEDMRDMRAAVAVLAASLSDITTACLLSH